MFDLALSRRALCELLVGLIDAAWSSVKSMAILTLRNIRASAPLTHLDSSAAVQVLPNHILVRFVAISAMESHACEKDRGVGVPRGTKNSGGTPHVGETKIGALRRNNTPKTAPQRRVRREIIQSGQPGQSA